MEKVKFGRFKVSKMALGTTRTRMIGVVKGAKLLERAYSLGINFWDTSDDYGSHPQVKKALDKIGRKNVIVTTKISARSYEQAKVCLDKCLRELGTKYADIILLHAVDSVEEFNARKEALRYLHHAKRKGLVRMVGLSTHTVTVAKHVAKFPKIEVLLATINFRGQHVMAGNAIDMKKALNLNHKKGKAVYAMKVFGGGGIKNRATAVEYVKALPFIDVLAIGVENIKQLEANVKYF